MIHSHRWLVVLAPLSFHDMRPWSTPRRAGPVLRDLLRDPDAIRALRPWWGSLGHRCDLHRVSDQALAEAILEAVSGRRIHVLVSAETAPAKPLETGSPKAAATGNATPLTAAMVATMPMTERVRRVLAQAVGLLPHAVGQDLLALIQPANLALMATAFAALAAAQFFGVGEVVDVGLAALAWVLGGKAALEGLAKLAEAAVLIHKAQSPADLDRAAKLVADGVNSMGVAALTVLLARAGRAAARTTGDAAADTAVAKPGPADFSKPVTRGPGPRSAPAPATATAQSGESAEIEAAKADQVRWGYVADKWEPTKLKVGAKVYGGLPGQSAYYTDAATLEAAQGSRSTLFQSLQVAPHPEFGYRPMVGEYEVVDDMAVPSGAVLANPAYGPGEGSQFFISKYSTSLRLLRQIPLGP